MIETPRRILIIRPSALGDVCRTVPVLASLRRAYPESTIDWLVRDTFAEAIAAHPDLSGVVPFPRARLHAWWKPTVAREAINWMRSLHQGAYDLVLDCQGLFRSGLFTWQTHAPHRVGYANAEELGWLGLTHRVSVPRSAHTVDRMLALVESIGVEPTPDLRLYAPPEARDRLDADEELRGRVYAVFAPTSAWPAKRWPAVRFAETARRLLDDPRSPVERIVIVGGPDERGQCRAVSDLALHDTRIIDRVGATSVGDLMALIERSCIVLANDSASLHIAVGFSRPLVALFGPTRVDLVGPYGREQDVVQHLREGDSLDHKRAEPGRMLMERIEVEDVVERLIHALPRAQEPSRIRHCAAAVS